MTSSRTRDFCNGCHSCVSPCGKERKESKFSRTVSKVLDEHSSLFEKLEDSVLEAGKHLKGGKVKMSKKKKKKDLYGYKITFDKLLVEESVSVEDYGDWSQQWSNKFDKIRREDNYPDLSAPFDIHESEVLYLVWVEYTEGDSFGSSVRGGAEAFGLFKSIHPANELAKAIKDHKTDREEWYPNPFYCKTRDGQIFDSPHPPWAGYFERLEEVHVEKIVLNHGNNKNVK